MYNAFWFHAPYSLYDEYIDGHSVAYVQGEDGVQGFLDPQNQNEKEIVLYIFIGRIKKKKKKRNTRTPVVPTYLIRRALRYFRAMLFYGY